MNNNDTNAQHPVLFASIYQQNWENARHIKSERIWFMNTYAFISAGILSLLHSIRGEALLEMAMVGFMCAFSVIGLLTSFRLKAELEECLEKLQAMVDQAGADSFVALGRSEGPLKRYPKFRWIFPVFYGLATGAFLILLISRLLQHGIPGLR